MITLAKTPLPHLKAYHRNQSLLFQFILYEFITSYNKTDSLKQFMQVLQKEHQEETSQENFDQIIYLFNKLSGSDQEYMRLFPWNPDGGVLTKLKNYCDLYAQCMHQTYPKALDLQKNVNQVWLYSQQGLDILRTLNPFSSMNKLSTRLLAPLLQIINKIQLTMQKIARFIAQALQQFTQDESILFFLLRHHKRFEELYDPEFIFKLLNKMYPKGIKDVEKFLIEKYQEKGFAHLIPIISEKIQELKLAFS